MKSSFQVSGIPIEAEQLRSALGDFGVGEIVGLTPLEGGGSAVYRLDLSDGSKLALKVYRDVPASSVAKEAFVASLLPDLDVPIPRFLAIDESRKRLPFRFALTTFLPGRTAGALRDHPDIASLYRQTGRLLKTLHSLTMPAYGAFGAEGIISPLPSNTAYIRERLDRSFAQFSAYGADPALVERLRALVEERFDSIVTHSRGPTFAHDDLHPNNVLAVEASTGGLALSGLIDFGNARAADAVSDLAKCLFCSEHDAPGSTQFIREGYGEIDHPNPEGALWFYTLLHRVTMWWWLRHVGALPTPDTPIDIIDDLRAMVAQPHPA